MKGLTSMTSGCFRWQSLAWSCGAEGRRWRHYIKAFLQSLNLSASLKADAPIWHVRSVALILYWVPQEGSCPLCWNQDRQLVSGVGALGIALFNSLFIISHFIASHMEGIFQDPDYFVLKANILFTLAFPDELRPEGENLMFVLQCRRSMYK